MKKRTDQLGAEQQAERVRNWNIVARTAQLLRRKGWKPDDALDVAIGRQVYLTRRSAAVCRGLRMYL